MHYFQYNIGDYAAHTKYLTNNQDLAYRRLLDLYYLQERPLTPDITKLSGSIGMNDCSTDVERVLNEFFILGKNGWSNKRADEEIAVFHGKSRGASKAGIASGVARRARKHAASERTFTLRSTESNGRYHSVEPTINHKPITNNHKPIKTKALSVIPEFIPETLWADFKAHRNQLKPKLTDLAETRLFATLTKLKDEGQDVVAVINRSIENGWKSFYPADQRAANQAKSGDIYSKAERVAG